jgi:hypothetical protein
MHGLEYITDRFLPDKAIDLVDQACATIRTEMGSNPTELVLALSDSFFNALSSISNCITRRFTWSNSVGFDPISVRSIMVYVFKTVH